MTDQGAAMARPLALATIRGLGSRKTVDYSALIGPLIEAVKELDDRLRAIEARLADSAAPDPK